jgi:tetratricopeptide (TPR) repeat protein
LAKKKKSAKSEIQKIQELEVPLNLSGNLKKIILAVLILLTIGIPYYFISSAYSVNHEHGFPLDDPWIHLTFARNLVEYGSFSYYKNEIVTAGSTSPIYTLILAAGFLITKNEMILSYVLGILFFAASAFSFYKLAGDLFPKDYWLVIGSSLIYALDKRINFISVSGMETTLFIFLLIACFYYYRRRNAVMFGLTLGLSFWTRPDSVAFIGAVIADYIIFLYFKKKSPKENEFKEFTKQDLIKTGAVFTVLMAAYFAMNLMLSGSLLPNTYDAKLTYYTPEFRSRTEFLKSEVWEYFTYASYALLIVPFIIAFIRIGTDSAKKRYNPFLLPVIFIFAMIFIYWYKLPYAHRFGRYLMPIIPFYIMVFAYGSRVFFIYLYRYFREKKLINALNIILIAAVIIYSLVQLPEHKNFYAEQTHHISIRQVTTAKWIRDNTPEGSVIATHDVGAIAYYSNRKIVDVVGLINPKFIKRIHDKDFPNYMIDQMKKENVTYIAFLREWYRIVNQAPLFSTGEQNFEIMDVFKFDPEKTHILSSEVTGMTDYGMQLLQSQRIQQGMGYLSKAVSIDPLSSLTYFYLAYGYSITGNAANTEKYLLKALEIYPGYHDAAIQLLQMYQKENRLSEARRYSTAYLKINPSDSSIVKILKSLPHDSTRVNEN